MTVRVLEAKLRAMGVSVEEILDRDTYVCWLTFEFNGVAYTLSDNKKDLPDSAVDSTCIALGIDPVEIWR